MTLRIIFFIISIYFSNAQRPNNELDKTIQDVFYTLNTRGFDTIVEPEPENLEPTKSPQILEQQGTSCKCVPYWKCNNNNQLSQPTESRFYGEIDVRYNPESCQDVLDVCCPFEQEVNVQQPQPQTPPPITNGPSDLQTPKKCGVRNPGGIDFTLVGNTKNEAGFAEFPWMVALLTSHKDCLCGGSLIHPQIVLTGAHCVFNISQNNLKVRAGEWDTQTTKERLPHQERNVNMIITHNEFNTKSLANDIALLFLDQPFFLDQHIGVVCLPSQGYIANNRDCFASGWGKDIFGKEGKYSVILKKVPLPMVPFNQCQERLKKTRLGNRFLLHPSFVCAGGEPNVDTCQGDGGSPLVCPIDANNRYVQMGSVAWGIACNLDIPGVYTNVALFRDWIDHYVKSYNFDTSVYTV